MAENLRDLILSEMDGKWRGPSWISHSFNFAYEEVRGECMRLAEIGVLEQHSMGRFRRKGMNTQPAVANVNAEQILQPGIRVVTEIPPEKTNLVTQAAFDALAREPIGTILRVTYQTRDKAGTGRNSIYHWAKRVGITLNIQQRGIALYVTKLGAKQ